MVARMGGVPDDGGIQAACHDDGVRPTRVVYVEDDPALRGIVSSLLRARAELELVQVAASATELLGVGVMRADVALLDLALGPESLTGIELGLRLRAEQPEIGIVVFTQHVVPDYVGNLPEAQQMGWSFVEKRADLDVDALVEILRSTARGLNVVDPAMARARQEAGPSPVERLTPRQQELMSMLATGHEAGRIADALGVTSTSVRKELSRAYAILVPDAQPGTDVRTVAVLRYLRETRRFDSGAARA